eukprot:s905_g17.t1
MPQELLLSKTIHKQCRFCLQLKRISEVILCRKGPNWLLYSLQEFLTRIPLSPGIGGDFRDAILKVWNPPCTPVQGVVLLLEGSTASSWLSWSC